VAVDGHDAVIGTFVVDDGPVNELGELEDADDFTMCNNSGEP